MADTWAPLDKRGTWVILGGQMQAATTYGSPSFYYKSQATTLQTACDGKGVEESRASRVVQSFGARRHVFLIDPMTMGGNWQITRGGRWMAGVGRNAVLIMHGGRLMGRRNGRGGAQRGLFAGLRYGGPVVV